jgi:hypothetical protein
LLYEGVGPKDKKMLGTVILANVSFAISAVAFLGGAGLVVVTWALARVISESNSDENPLSKIGIFIASLLICFAVSFFNWSTAYIGFIVALVALLAQHFWRKRKRKMQIKNVDFVVDAPLLDNAVSPRLMAEMVELEARARQGHPILDTKNEDESVILSEHDDDEDTLIELS